MQINWKLRLKNKTTVAALLAALVAFVYQVCGIFGVVPPVSQDQALTFVSIILTVLVSLGILVDPTTAGLGDSERAMGYEKPAKTDEADAEA